MGMLGVSCSYHKVVAVNGVFLKTCSLFCSLLVVDDGYWLGPELELSTGMLTFDHSMWPGHPN